MQINRRVTNGLAWAGLFLVVGIPVADMVSAQLMGDPESIAVVSTAEAPVPAPLSQRPAAPVAAKPVAQTAEAAPAKPVVAPVAKPETVPLAQTAAASGNVVDSYLSSGKKLPSYITGGDEAAPAPIAAAPQAEKPVAPVTSTPAVVPPAQTATTPARTPIVTDPVEVASVTPQKIAPVPMPLSMRPTPVPQPLVNQAANNEIVIPERDVADYNEPVTAEDLQDWETGPLSDFLAQQERTPRDRSEATYRRENRDRNFDADGFFLNDGPNREPRGDRYIGPVQEEFYFPFVN